MSLAAPFSNRTPSHERAGSRAAFPLRSFACACIAAAVLCSDGPDPVETPDRAYLLAEWKAAADRLEPGVSLDGAGWTQPKPVVFLSTPGTQNSRAVLDQWEGGATCLMRLSPDERESFVGADAGLAGELLFLHEAAHCVPFIAAGSNTPGVAVLAEVPGADGSASFEAQLARESFSDIYAILALWRQRGAEGARAGWLAQSAERHGTDAAVGYNDHSTEGGSACLRRRTSNFSVPFPSRDAVRKLEADCVSEALAVYAYAFFISPAPGNYAKMISAKPNPRLGKPVVSAVDAAAKALGPQNTRQVSFDEFRALRLRAGEAFIAARHSNG